jgi:hypothetical protein
MPLKVFTMPAALLLLLCVACNQSQKQSATASMDVASKSTDGAADKEEEFKQPAPGKSANQANTPAPGAPNPDWERKIVKTADLNIEVKNFPAFTDRLHRAVRQSSGYISQEQQVQTASGIENTVTIRIPVDQFDDLLMQLPSDSDRLVEKKVSSEDVTLEMIDTKSRLETKKQVRERYRDLLKQANNTQDILALQGEIDGIQEQLEAASGRIAFLDHSAAFSTINLKFYQVLNVGTPVDTRPSFLHKLKLSWLEGWEWCSSLILGLLSVWPLWLTAGLGWGAWRRHRARFTKTPAE